MANVGGLLKGTERTIKRFIDSPGGLWYPKSTSDLINFMFSLPEFYDRSDLKIVVRWSSGSTTTTDTITFRARYATATIDSGALRGASLTALDTTIVADSPTATADSIMHTAAGIINPGNMDSEKVLLIALDVSAVSGIVLGPAKASRVAVHGIQLEFAPKLTTS